MTQEYRLKDGKFEIPEETLRPLKFKVIVEGKTTMVFWCKSYKVKKGHLYFKHCLLDTSDRIEQRRTFYEFMGLYNCSVCILPHKPKDF